MMRPTPIWTVLVVVLALGACGDDTTDPATTPSSAAPTTTAAPIADTTDENGDATRPSERDVVERAAEDLADRLDVPVADIDVEGFERVTWTDGSLGCPQPGELYTQALVEGSRVVLTVDGAEYHYHAGADDRPFLCEEPAVDATTGPAES